MSKRMVQPTWVMAALAAAFGCGEQGSQEAATVDSSVCVAVGPALTVGGMEPPDHVFGMVPDVSLLPDSGFVAIDRQADEIHFFDSRGQFVRALGGTGEGPGELADPIAVQVVDATVFVWDWGQSRINAYDPESGDLETWVVPGQANPRHHFGRIDAGFVIGTTTGDVLRSGPPGTSWTRDLGVVVYDPSSGTADTVAHVPDEAVTLVDQFRTNSPVFSPRASMAVSGGRVYWSRGDSALVVRSDGGQLDTLRWEWPLRPVATGDLEAYREQVLASRPEALHPEIHRRFASTPIEETFPVAEELVPDLDGGVWVQVYAAPRDTTRTYVRLADDRVVCQVELPKSFIAWEGGQSWLLGVSTDELDVPRVERWTLVGAQR